MDEMKDRKVILVSKDINLRLKAKSIGIQAEDYTTGKVQNVISLYTGTDTVKKIEPEMINLLYEQHQVPIEEVYGTKLPIKIHFRFKIQ